MGHAVIAQSSKAKLKTKSLSAVNSKSSSNEDVTVEFIQFTAYSNYTGYYIAVYNNTASTMSMDFDSDIFNETHDIYPGYNVVHIVWAMYVDNLKIRCSVHEPGGYNFNLFVYATGYN